MAAKKWTCTLAMGCYPGGLPFEREERSPILRSTEHPHPQAHIFQGQTQWRFQMRRPEPKLVTKTQLPSSIWASLCHLFDNLTAKGSPYLVTTVSAKLIMHGLSLLFFHLFPLSLFFGLVCPGQCWQCCLWRRCIRNPCPFTTLIFPMRSVVGFGGSSDKKSRYP